jgi:hypothetical protein
VVDVPSCDKAKAVHAQARRLVMKRGDVADRLVLGPGVDPPL